MPWPFLVALAGIAWLAYMGYLDHKAKLAKQGGAGLEEALREVLGQLEEGEAERANLRTRVENLEAIVTSERYELDREAQRALGAARPEAEAGPRLALDVEAPEAERDEARAAELARRARTGA